MAGDWIKMRHSLLSHPKTVRMMSALKADKFRIVGGLMSVWCLFDTHSEDGQLSRYTLETLDAMAAWDGFSAAMQAVEWLGVEDDGTLVLPRFDTHNGQSAKRRAQDSDRKREVRKLSASEADKKRTREEKRREEEKEEKISASPDGEALPLTAERQPAIPYQAIVTAYNATMVNLPKVREISADRKTAMRKAWMAGEQRQSVEFWRAYFEECAAEPFTNGTGPYTGEHANWRPDFDYLMRGKVITRIFERAMDRLERSAA